MSNQFPLPFVLLTLAIPAQGTGRAQGPDPSFTLAGSTVQDRRLSGKESHGYTLEFTPGRWRVAVEQMGLDVVFELWDPAAEHSRRLDNPSIP